MTSSPTITLFSQQPDLHQRPTSFVASILIHAASLSLISFGFLYQPRLDSRLLTEHYTVRTLDLHPPDEQMRRARRGGITYPGPRLIAHSAAPGKPASPRPRPLRIAVQAKHGQQTLVQPDLITHLNITPAIPIAQVVLWSPRSRPVKEIVAPQPEKPTASDVTPSLDPPNQELNLADVNIASSPRPALKQPVAASTTAPIKVQAPGLIQMAPDTVAQLNAQPTPVAVMSLSSLRMKDGTVVLPPLNETASANTSGTLTAASPRDLSQPGDGVSSSAAGASGAGKNAADPAATKNSGAQSSAAVAGLQQGATKGAAQGSESGAGQSDQSAATQITLPKNGQFGAVVIGDSLQDEFPESAGVWNGRLAYTVYLHVGLARSWILQYALPSAADAAAGGDVAHLEAPWPYNIVRPNLAPGAIDADALMIHGFVNQTGRFEDLSLVFPQVFPQAQFVLDSLQQWQFRPATQDGQSAKVEILLIIPEEMD